MEWTPEISKIKDAATSLNDFRKKPKKILSDKLCLFVRSTDLYYVSEFYLII